MTGADVLQAPIPAPLFLVRLAFCWLLTSWGMTWHRRRQGHTSKTSALLLHLHRNFTDTCALICCTDLRSLALSTCSLCEADFQSSRPETRSATQHSKFAKRRCLESDLHAHVCTLPPTKVHGMAQCASLSQLDWNRIFTYSFHFFN